MSGLELTPEVIASTRHLLGSAVERLEAVAAGHTCADLARLLRDIETCSGVFRVERGEVPRAPRPQCSPAQGCTTMAAEDGRAWARRMANLLGAMLRSWHAPFEYPADASEEGPEPGEVEPVYPGFVSAVLD